MPGMLVGKVLRSPHAHARIKSIDTSAAEKLPGVKAVVTGDGLPRPAQPDRPDRRDAGQPARHHAQRHGAREGALRGPCRRRRGRDHRRHRRRRRSTLIKVDYEVLPHVIDVDEAMKPTTRRCCTTTCITEGVKPAPTKPSNIAKRIDNAKGDVDAGFAAGRRRRRARATPPQPVHQGYIEPHACARQRWPRTARSQIWSTHARATSRCAASAAGCSASRPRRSACTPTEIGGGFGGKTVVYLEPVAVAAVAEVRPPGEDGDDARRGVPRHRPDVGRARPRQDRRQEGRHDRRRRVHDRATRPAPSRARRSARRCMDQLRLLRHPERQGRSATTW